MQANQKERLDILVFKKGFASSRQKAKILVIGGYVFVDGKRILKPSMAFSENCVIDVKENCFKYVGRGGLKLEKALNSFKISPKGLNCMDVGASTGGFTDVMLQSGAKVVYAIDVGFGQLHESLKNNSKVVNLEHTNIRDIQEDKIKHGIDFFSVDVSFISLTLVLPKIRNLVRREAFGVCLIKPQFEAGKENVGKNGVVKSEKVHENVLKKICNFCLSNGFSVLGLDYSPVKGQDGNIEYLAYIKKSESPLAYSELNIKKLVKDSHGGLKSKEIKFV